MVPLNSSPKRSLTRILVMWNVALTVLVLVGMALYASAAQAANDPPVSVFTANADDVGGDGDATVNNRTVNSTSYTELRKITTERLGASHPHTCVVIASATAQHSSGEGTYIFALSMDSEVGSPGGSQRRIELFDNAGINDDNVEEVSTVYTFDNVQGVHDFRFLGRKQSAGDSHMEVDAASMSVICLKKNIGPFGLAPGDQE
jgi:hypothetical protein